MHMATIVNQMKTIQTLTDEKVNHTPNNISDNNSKNNNHNTNNDNHNHNNNLTR